jgi:hypothetical protein
MIWVMAQNGGCEGHSAPFQAFTAKETAMAALALMTAAGHSGIEVFEIPIWPAVGKEPYWSSKPVVPAESMLDRIRSEQAKKDLANER